MYLDSQNANHSVYNLIVTIYSCSTYDGHILSHTQLKFPHIWFIVIMHIVKFVQFTLRKIVINHKQGDILFFKVHSLMY